ncbi:unnamed protein product, partial [Heterotrigona itama]
VQSSLNCSPRVPRSKNSHCNFLMGCLPFEVAFARPHFTALMSSSTPSAKLVPENAAMHNLQALFPSHGERTVVNLLWRRGELCKPTVVVVSFTGCCWKIGSSTLRHTNETLFTYFSHCDL